MTKEKTEKGKKCFIITPIGNVDSLTFRKAKGVIENVIKPVLKSYGFDNIEAAYEISTTGMITAQIINRIISDDLVIANLTDSNPNVMYELCLRHTIAKPIIHICESGTVLSFDIKDNRTIFYRDDLLGGVELKKELQKFLERMDYSCIYTSNPIHSSDIVFDEIYKIIRKGNYIDDINRTKMRVTITGIDESSYDNITDYLSILGFIKLDFCGKLDLTKCSVYETKCSDFTIDWLYEKICGIAGDKIMGIKIERM